MTMERVMGGTLLAAAAISIVSISLVAALLSSSQTVPNLGTVAGVGVGVYWDYAGTNQTTSIDWGTLSPGDTKYCTVFVKNVGNDPVTLSMATSGWNPTTAPTYINVIWNSTGVSLPSHNSVAAAKFTLTALSTTTGITNFSFNITITGS